MKSEEPQQSLSSISSVWTVFSQAHRGSAKAVQAAQGELLQRYTKAIHRYLLGALRDPEAADELNQEFALRFIRGELGRANPDRGRFRDFVKGVLSHLIVDHYRRRSRSRRLPKGVPEPAAPDAHTANELVKSRRGELLQRAWEALAELQAETRKPFHTVLRYRIDRPELKSDKLAEHLSAQLGRRVSAVWVRQTLHRARQKFIDLLLQAVQDTMSHPTIDDLKEELGELGLLKYCGPALERLRSQK
jgi:RNA polymerase sigma-70 factor (ECF subfamily)